MIYREISPDEVKLDKTLGYYYFLDKYHPLASPRVHKVYYHRHMASIKLGRWLVSNEHVHHIDHDKSNNCHENLQVLSAEEHRAVHKLEHDITHKLEEMCPVCSNIFLVSINSSRLKTCCSAKCRIEHSIKWQITKEELEPLIWNYSYSYLSGLYGMSDVGIKKRAMSLGCNMPPPRFSSRTEAYRKELRNQNNITDLSTQ